MLNFSNILLVLVNKTYFRGIRYLSRYTENWENKNSKGEKDL